MQHDKVLNVPHVVFQWPESINIKGLNKTSCTSWNLLHSHLQSSSITVGCAHLSSYRNRYPYYGQLFANVIADWFSLMISSVLRRLLALPVRSGFLFARYGSVITFAHFSYCHCKNFGCHLMTIPRLIYFTSIGIFVTPMQKVSELWWKCHQFAMTLSSFKSDEKIIQAFALKLRQIFTVCAYMVSIKG